MINKKPKIICLTPVKNEEWIMDNFLKSVSLWADHIIIADQNSTDATRAIAKKYSKVELVNNPYIGEYNEQEVRRITIEEARKFKGPKILFALDSDEVLSPPFNNEEWTRLVNLEPGTVIKSKFINIKPDMKHFWDGPMDIILGFSDDGSEYVADKIHTNRMIYPKNAPVFLLKDIKVMHLQYIDWNRMESKHRWYQCWERLNKPEQSAIRLYRNYHHMDAIKKDELKKIPEDWLEYYQKLGIDLKSFKKEKEYYWDNIVLDYIKKYGARHFSRESIWNINWEKKAKRNGLEDVEKFKDPRNIIQKIIHLYLKKTQYHHKNILIRAKDKIMVDIFRM